MRSVALLAGLALLAARTQSPESRRIAHPRLPVTLLYPSRVVGASWCAESIALPVMHR
jgi:hypothetical protein